MLLEARERAGKAEGSAAPPMATWSPEVAMLALLIEAVRVNTFYTRAAAGDKNPPKPEPVVRPRTAMDRVKVASRRRQHEKLVARILPHKGKSND